MTEPMLDFAVSPPANETLPERVKLCVLGGGAAGISIARHLRGRGCDEIAVLEKEPRVGGKCHSVLIDGRPHDLGAVLGLPGDCDELLALSKSLGLETCWMPPQQRVFLRDGLARRPLASKTCDPRLWFEAVKYLFLHRFTWGCVSAAALHRVPRELCAPWQQVAERRRLRRFSAASLHARTGFGYGFDESTPALYMINNLRSRNVINSVRCNFVLWKSGMQAIWSAAAQTVPVWTGVRVKRIVRKNEVVLDLETAQGEQTLRAERLVIACNPKNLLNELDADSEERLLYQQIRNVDYRSYALRVADWETGVASTGYFSENMCSSEIGRPLGWMKRYPDQDVGVFYAFGAADISDSDVLEKIQADLSRLGGSISEVCNSKQWDYFPHVGSAALERGFYEKLASRQGERRTYLTGELLSFSSLPRVLQNAGVVAARVAEDLKRTQRAFSMRYPPQEL